MDWVYVGVREAAVLGGVSMGAIERLIASDQLQPAAWARNAPAGRLRNLYRLDEVLAVVRETRR
ncbi:MAG: hypothetical protein ACE5IZ_09730 [Dehalococcoidia bacterium]